MFFKVIILKTFLLHILFGASQNGLLEVSLHGSPRFLCQLFQNQAIAVDICLVGGLPTKEANFRWDVPVSL